MKIIAAANGTLVLLVYALIQSCISEESLCLHYLLIGSYNGSRNMWVVVFIHLALLFSTRQTCTWLFFVGSLLWHIIFA
ncbi:hypothetical protein I3843_08G001400 [Carya illinoinensis]|uniref:Uncharacterized protein n=1 Tax=Carya illinoinensis TaxID=32201 RepID=A0A922J929_CARIL|nr:hypothetical protein I3760_08G001400 [Carya illinoinensis]KAG6698033.1 hypothetical protein I3842_08G001400 [Carya illinoinensis]KAG7965437.1 hypothetical protein I3843_08G001400 [Carya illinoinensis]